MTDTKTKTKIGKSPTHIAYSVRETDDDSYFTRIGAAWPHKDRKGFSIQLESLPIDGKIVLRIPTPKEDKEAV